MVNKRPDAPTKPIGSFFHQYHYEHESTNRIVIFWPQFVNSWSVSFMCELCNIFLKLCKGNLG